MGIPVTFVIGPDGKVVNRHVGFGPGMEKEFGKEIETLLGLAPSNL